MNCCNVFFIHRAVYDIQVFGNVCMFIIKKLVSVAITNRKTNGYVKKGKFVCKGKQSRHSTIIV